MKRIENPFRKLLEKLFGGKVIPRATLMVGTLFVASILLVQGIAGWYCIDQNSYNISEYRDGKFSQVNDLFAEQMSVGREMLSRLSNLPTVHEFQYRDRITSSNYKKTSALFQYIAMVELGNPGLRVYIDFPRSGSRLGSDGLYASQAAGDRRYIVFSGESPAGTPEDFRLIPDVTVTTGNGSYQASILALETERLVIRVVYPAARQNSLLESALREDASVGAVLSPDGALLACTEGLTLPGGLDSAQSVTAAFNAGTLGKDYDFEVRETGDGIRILIGFNRNTPLNRNIRNNRYFALINLVSLACMLVWLLIFSFKIFRPVQSIALKIKSMQMPGIGNEFNLIGSLIDSMNLSIHNLSTRLSDRQDLVLENTINRLVAGSDIPEEIAGEFDGISYVVLTLVCERDGAENREDILRFENALEREYPLRRFYRMNKQWSYFMKTDSAGIDAIVRIASGEGYTGFLILGVSRPRNRLGDLREALEESREVFGIPLAQSEAAGRMVYRCSGKPGTQNKLRIGTQEESKLLGYIFRGEADEARRVFDAIHAENAGLSIGQQQDTYIYLINLLYIYGREYSIVPAADPRALDRIRETYDPAMMNRIAFEEYRSVADLFKTEESVLGKIIRYVGENYSKNINLRQITDELGVSYTNVSRLFNKKLGISFPDYLNHMRVERAKILIAETEASISVVSEQVGFDLVNTFNRIFKKSTGMTPSDWRKSHGKVSSAEERRLFQRRESPTGESPVV